MDIDDTISIDGTEINGTYMEYDTMISNSNGNYWAASTINIAAGINDAIEDVMITQQMVSVQYGCLLDNTCLLRK